MASVGDVVQATLEGLYLGQSWANVFHFQVTIAGGGGSAPLSVREGFVAGVLTDLLGTMNAGTHVDRLYSVNLADPTEFDDYTINDDGTFSVTNADYLPSNLAWTLRYGRANPTFRNGYKRFIGLTETQVTGNALSSVQTEMQNVADTLYAGWFGTTDGSQYISPFVARRPIVYGTNPAGYVPVNIQVLGLSHQNSRWYQ